MFAKDPIWIINYLFLTLVGILCLMKWNNSFILNSAHLYAFVKIIFAMKSFIYFALNSGRLMIFVSMFGVFILWTLFIHLFYIISMGGELIWITHLFTFITLNIALGLFVGLAIQTCSFRRLSQVIRYQSILLVLATVFLLYLIIFGEHTAGWLRLYFEDYEDFYQTVAGYGARIILTIIFVLSASKSIKLTFVNCLIPLVFILLFAIFSLLLGSKKEVILFVFLWELLIYKISKSQLQFIVFNITIAFIVYFVSVNLSNDFVDSIHFLSDLERSTSERAKYLDYYDMQLQNSGILGNPFIWMTVGGMYPHSFLLSLYQATGVIGFLLFMSMFGFLMFCVLSIRRFDIAIMVIVIFLMANFATYFDYFVMWYMIGLASSLLFHNRLKFSTSTQVIRYAY
jgi:hypothetical protein